MYKALKPLILTILLSVCFVVSANAQETIEINSLINSANSYDNQMVTVEGEAIGEALERGNYAWVNINDGTNAIGIWMKISDAKAIEYFGDNKHIGDILEITGVFTRNCSEHGGDVDIHLNSMEIVKKGYVVNDEISSTKAIAAAILLSAALIISFFYIKDAKKKRQ